MVFGRILRTVDLQSSPFGVRGDSISVICPWFWVSPKGQHLFIEQLLFAIDCAQGGENAGH